VYYVETWMCIPSTKCDSLYHHCYGQIYTFEKEDVDIERDERIREIKKHVQEIYYALEEVDILGLRQ
jgi:hypothetical protein